MTPSYFVDESGCWLWTGRLDDNGYPKWGDHWAHRRMWESHRGPIPAGMEIDHLCRTPACVNPDHLEVVTPAENRRRQPNVIAQRARAHCPHGHPYAGDNLRLRPNGKRACRACDRANSRRQVQDRRRNRAIEGPPTTEGATP